MRGSAALLGRRKFHLQRRQRRRGERLAVAPDAPVHAPRGDGGGLVDMAGVEHTITIPDTRLLCGLTAAEYKRVFRACNLSYVSSGDSGSSQRPGHEPSPDSGANPSPDLGPPSGGRGDGVRPRIGDREHLYDADDQPTAPDPVRDLPDDPWLQVRVAELDSSNPRRDRWGSERY